MNINFLRKKNLYNHILNLRLDKLQKNYLDFIDFALKISNVLNQKLYDLNFRI